METIVDFKAKDTKKISETFFSKRKTDFPLCPVKDIMHTLGDKWSVLIMMTLGARETLRFNEIRHAVDGISQKMLTVTLRELESFGMVTREIYPQIPPRVEYTITPLGKEFLTHLAGMLEWACANSERIAANRTR